MQLKKGQLWKSRNSGVIWRMLSSTQGVVVESGNSGYGVGKYKELFNDLGGPDWELVNNKADSFTTLYEKLIL